MVEVQEPNLQPPIILIVVTVFCLQCRLCTDYYCTGCCYCGKYYNTVFEIKQEESTELVLDSIRQTTHKNNIIIANVR